MTNLVNVFIKSIWGSDKPKEVKQEPKKSKKKKKNVSLKKMYMSEEE